MGQPDTSSVFSGLWSSEDAREWRTSSLAGCPCLGTEHPPSKDGYLSIFCESSILQWLSFAFGASLRGVCYFSALPQRNWWQPEKLPFTPKLKKPTSCCPSCPVPSSSLLCICGLHWTCCIGSVSVLRRTGELKLKLSIADAQLQEVLISPFLWLVKVRLKSSPLLQCIWHSPQSGSIFKLAENTLSHHTGH